MKYEITLHKTTRKTIQLFAETRDEALKSARNSNPDFRADDVTELGEDEEPVTTHESYGTCESCEKIIWDGNKYATDGDGICVCGDCCELQTPNDSSSATTRTN